MPKPVVGLFIQTVQPNIWFDTNPRNYQDTFSVPNQISIIWHFLKLLVINNSVLTCEPSFREETSELKMVSQLELANFWGKKRKKSLDICEHCSFATDLGVGMKLIYRNQIFGFVISLSDLNKKFQIKPDTNTESNLYSEGLKPLKVAL